MVKRKSTSVPRVSGKTFLLAYRDCYAPEHAFLELLHDSRHLLSSVYIAPELDPLAVRTVYVLLCFHAKQTYSESAHWDFYAHDRWYRPSVSPVVHKQLAKAWIKGLGSYHAFVTSKAEQEDYAPRGLGLPSPFPFPN